MRSRQIVLTVLIFTSLLSWNACKKDKTPVDTGESKYSTGIFVVNQGSATLPGTITWHSLSSDETVTDLYGSQNNGAKLGGNVQSISFFNGNVYICSGTLDKVLVVDAATFKLKGSIDGLAQPRYFYPVSTQYAYVSQWGFNGLNGSLAKVDMSANAVVSTISTGTGPDQMLLHSIDNTLYVANSGGSGVDSTISVIDLNTDKERPRIKLPYKNPCCLVHTGFNGGNYAVLCQGSKQDASPSGWLGQTEDKAGFVLDPFGAGLCTNFNGSLAYVSAGGKVYQWDNLGLKPLINQSANGIAVSRNGGYIYCSDPKDFGSAGEVVKYDANGQKLSSFAVGISPGQIVILE
jgi:DNA-binding beta-propeller fold protein YncE